jgi:uncharacterized SAM-binding protein YcdF (DUF218 family)
VALVALVFFTNPFIIGLLLRAYETKPVELAPTETYASGIVLGGFISYNARDDKAYFNPASDRFIQTALLYKTGHIKKIIVSAGNGYITKNNFREADFIRDHLVQLGIPPQDILGEAESRNTLENARFSKAIRDTAHITGTSLLISSAMHLPRAKLVFEKAGIPVKLYPCDFIGRGGGNNLIEDVLLPSSGALYKWDNFIKELVGIVTYKITGKG